MTVDTQEIRELLARRDRGIAAGDAAAAVAPYAEGAVQYDLQPPLEIGFSREEATEGVGAWLKTWNGLVTSELKSPEVIVSGDLAVAYGLANMRGDKKGEGPSDLWFRSTVVLKKQDGEWRIVHEHSSVPMMMDGSQRAATDLKPERG